jgi:hypothetical protein
VARKRAINKVLKGEKMKTIQTSTMAVIMVVLAMIALSGCGPTQPRGVDDTNETVLPILEEYTGITGLKDGDVIIGSEETGWQLTDEHVEFERGEKGIEIGTYLDTEPLDHDSPREKWVIGHDEIDGWLAISISANSKYHFTDPNNGDEYIYTLFGTTEGTIFVLHMYTDAKTKLYTDGDDVFEDPVIYRR